MFSFTAASLLNSSNSRCTEMILENCPGRRRCDSDEDQSECQPTFFRHSELFEKKRWQRRSTGIIVLLLCLKRLIHHAAAGSGGVRRRRRMAEEEEEGGNWQGNEACRLLYKRVTEKKGTIKSPYSWYFLTQRKSPAFPSHHQQWFIILVALLLLILSNESTILTISPTVLAIFFSADAIKVFFPLLNI